MNSKSIRNGFAAVTLSSSFLILPVAYAQTDAETESNAEENLILEEVIVTARYREERLQDIGASVSAYSGEMIDAAGMLDFEDIVRRTAGLNLLDRGPNQNEVSIRGVANELPPQTADGGNVRPLVTQYLDEVQFASPTAAQRDINLFDLDRVEVLKGPQPTYFGEGSMGGTIRYFSRNPSLSADQPFSGRINGTYEYTDSGEGSYRVQGVVDATFVPDVFGIRAVAFYRDDGGFIDNPVTGENNANHFESKGGRLVALWKANDQFTARFTAHVQRDEPGEAYEIDRGNEPDELQFSPAIPGERHDDFDLYSAILTYEFETMTLTSVTGIRERNSFRNTYDGGNSGGLSFLYATPVTVFSRVELDEEDFSQELRFVSDFDSALNLTGGLLYADSDRFNFVDATSEELSALIHDPNDILPGDSAFYQELNFSDSTKSAFIEFSYDFSEKSRMFAGVRYFDQKIKADLIKNPSFAPQPNPVTFVPFLVPILVRDNVAVLNALGIGAVQTFSVSEWLPRIAFEHNFTDDVMLYASYAQGARNGGFNSPLSAIGAPNGFEEAVAFEPDYLDTYEIGLKTVLLDGSLVLNSSLYLNQFEDPQTQIVPVATQLYANGPDLDVLGVEVEANFRFNDNWSGYFAGTYTDGEFQESFSLGAAGTIAEGNSPSGLPDVKFATGMDFNYPVNFGSGLSIFGRLDFQYTDERYGSPQNFALSELGSLQVLNARIGLGGDTWSVTGYVNNVLNDLEYQLLGLAAGGGAVVTSYVNRPLTAGVIFDYSF